MEKLTPERRQWIERHVFPWEPHIREWLRRYARISRDQVDDVIQAAYARLCSVDLSRITVARSYFQRIVLNEFLDARRRAPIVEIDCNSELASLPITEAVGPERVISARQLYQRLLEAVKELPVQQRAVFEFRKFEELSVEEISRRMGIGEKTVRTHLRRAQTRVLRVMYGEESESATFRSGERDDGDKARK